MVIPAPSLPKDFAQLSLAETLELLAARKLPPVDDWHPERTGDSAMEIRAGGSWYHEGGRINRPAMVRLFSTILRREPDGSHVLVTPAEKLAITPYSYVVPHGDQIWLNYINLFVDTIKLDGRLLKYAKKHKLDPIVAP